METKNKQEPNLKIEIYSVMKKRLLLLMVLAGSCFVQNASANNSVWQKTEGRVPTTGTQVIVPDKLSAYALNDTYLKNYLFSLNDNPNANQQIELPTPDGGFRTFVIWKAHTMSAGLEAKYPNIRTFTAYALDNPRVVAKLDYTLKGFHAMVMDGANTFFIDPYSNVNDGYYMSYYKHDFVKPVHQRMACEFKDNDLVSVTEQLEEMNLDNETDLPALDLKVINGTQHRTYRLALACTYEYSVAVDGPTPTVAGVLSAMVTSVNRVTGVYELEMAITLELVANTDDLIWITNSDPYSNGNGSTMLGQNQTQCTNIIGSANYDIGHVFSTGGGGIASLGSICGSNKGQGVTGSANPVGDPFDIDYVAHEIGHQFGGPHTFNSPEGSCSGNRSGSNAYEPGSGTTIMAYAGICDADDLQPHSDAYFHANSLQRIYNEITKTSKTNCPVKVTTGNAAPGLPSFMATYSIPISTPFELEAPLAIDSLVADTLLTYCWEEWDRSSSALTWVNTSATGPIFRSFLPTESRWRVFPTIQKVVTNVSSYLGEKLPTVARSLTFRLTARGVYNGLGVTNFSDDSVKLTVVNTGAGFAVTAPNTNVTWLGGTQETVTWNVVNTDQAPINATNVNIYLSVDGGYTYPHVVATNVPNTGSANITVPNVPNTTLARIKVKGAGNVFFDISNVNFRIDFNPNSVAAVAAESANIKVFPVPAKDVLNLSATEAMKVTIYNTVGQSVYTGVLAQDMQVNVKDWAKGMYYIHFTTEAGKRFSKTVAIQ
jgi:hypothetical protein